MTLEWINREGTLYADGYSIRIERNGSNPDFPFRLVSDWHRQSYEYTRLEHAKTQAVLFVEEIIEFEGAKQLPIPGSDK
jgi:hypothetical protein